ncbi:MAG: hypothetical protein KGI78_03445 [Patescibacteria group bacterium]|nr:hypothetical protein [Patescibacteria group bacterium]MDE1944162.1 hypothetical protein [Patescibacteria group bacterium]MDE1945088.1 hypothetical protein [Patescibacteria group bacterium]MDE2057882.1 hypothetical protein [Patescibacteria group bacterium]
MDRLGRLFGSLARVKLLRLFVFNQGTSFTLADAARRSSLDGTVVRRELAALREAGVVAKRGDRALAKYQANARYEHLAALEAFIRDTTILRPEYILAALRKAGTLRVVALSGLFTGAVETRVDLLVAGDNLDLRAIAKAVRTLEAELGREIRYAVFETPEFRYRLGVYDRLLRDVFDYPHRLLVDRIGLTP